MHRRGCDLWAAAPYMNRQDALPRAKTRAALASHAANGDRFVFLFLSRKNRDSCSNTARLAECDSREVGSHRVRRVKTQTKEAYAYRRKPSILL